MHRIPDLVMCQSYQSLNSEEVQETPGQGLNPFFFRLVLMDDKRLKKIKVHFTVSGYYLRRMGWDIH